MPVETPQIGTIVQFFLGADTNREPVPAVVTQAGNQPGMVRLSLMEVNSQTLKPVAGYVRHIDDPWIKENPHWFRTRTTAGAYRIFDMRVATSGHMMRCGPTAPEASYANKDNPAKERQQQGREIAESLLKEGQDPDAVFDRVKTYGVKKKEVEALSIRV